MPSLPRPPAAPFRPTARLAVALLLLWGACTDAPSKASDAAPPDARVDGVAPPDGVLPDAEGAIDGPSPDDTDLRAIQGGDVAPGTIVTVAGVVITAVGEERDGAGALTAHLVFVQEPAGEPAWSGLRVRVPVSVLPASPLRGELATIRGSVVEASRPGYAGSRTGLDSVTSFSTGGAATIPSPAAVPETDLVIGAPAAEQWEGVLVTVADVTVASRDPNGEVTLGAGLKVDDALHAWAQPWPGDTFDELRGVVDHDYGTARLLPRGADDLVGFAAAPPVPTALDPATLTVGSGLSVEYTVTLDRPVPAAGATIALDSTNVGVASPEAATVAATPGETSATFLVHALGAGGPVEISAEVAGEVVTASLTVLQGVDPILLGVGPDPVTVAAGGGTAILSVVVDRPVPAGGAPVAIASAAPAVSVPASVIIPGGATAATFRVRADAPGAAGAVVITATLPTGSVTATVLVIDAGAASAPIAGDLVLNEVHYDVPSTAGDANCDGVTSADNDEFVELVSRAAVPLDLGGVSLWDDTSWAAGLGTSPRWSFPAGLLLGPGEMIVVYGGPPGAVTADPWCANADGARVGDAVAVSTSSLGLTNGGDTVYLTAGGAATDPLLDSAAVAAGTDEAWTRSPDATGATLVAHTAAPGHALDRRWTPGTLLTGAPVAAAGPAAPPPLPDGGLPDAPAIDAGLPDAPSTEPTLIALSPSSVEVLAAGGTAILRVSLAAPAPAGGAIVALTSAAPATVSVPASVTVPAGATTVGFRVRAPAAVAAGPVAITATLPSGPLVATATVVTSVTGPAAGDLLINEVNHAPPATDGDANCNGTVETSYADEFVELVNVSARPFHLDGVSVWDVTAWAAGAGTSARWEFPASVILGAGEAVVVFGGALGTTGTSPWCTNLDGAHLGDAIAFAGASMILNNAGDTVYVTAGPTAGSVLLDSVAVPDGFNEAWTRSPDITGAFVRHGAAPGAAADRVFSPGTLVSGAPFSAANP